MRIQTKEGYYARELWSSDNSRERNEFENRVTTYVDFAVC
jgi:hypothetical protein